MNNNILLLHGEIKANGIRIQDDYAVHEIADINRINLFFCFCLPEGMENTNVLVNTFRNNCITVEYFALLREYRLLFFGLVEMRRLGCLLRKLTKIRYNGRTCSSGSGINSVPRIVRLTSSCVLCSRSSLKWTCDRSH